MMGKVLPGNDCFTIKGLKVFIEHVYSGGNMKSKQNKRKTLTGVAAIFLILIYFATSFAGT
jgi:hypothetical protein